MSKTYKDIRRYKVKKFWEDWYTQNCENDVAWRWSSWPDSHKERLVFISKNRQILNNRNQFDTDYCSAPSWFTRMYGTVPRRRKEALLITKAIADPDSSDSLVVSIS